MGSAGEQFAAANAGTLVGGPRRYRKKPVEVDAIQFTGSNDDQVAEFVGPDGVDPEADRPTWLLLPSGTLHADPLTVEVGDWIVRGVRGELDPCKADIFDATYEPA